MKISLMAYFQSAVLCRSVTKLFGSQAKLKRSGMEVKIMSDDIKRPSGEPEEEMSVELELEDGTVVNCAVITILEVDGNNYIVLLPLDEDGKNDDGEVWFYGYSENPDDPNEEPQLHYIDDDAEYESVADAFDEYLDSCEFDELVDADEDV